MVKSVRLACLMCAASVYPEPGSNSLFKFQIILLNNFYFFKSFFKLLILIFYFLLVRYKLLGLKVIPLRFISKGFTVYFSMYFLFYFVRTIFIILYVFFFVNIFFKKI